MCKQPTTDAKSVNSRSKANSTVAILYTEYQTYNSTTNWTKAAWRLDNQGNIDVCMTSVNVNANLQIVTLNETTSSRVGVAGFGGFSVSVPSGTTVLYSSR